jgi:L-histidine N-alpha-methyltransferase
MTSPARSDPNIRRLSPEVDHSEELAIDVRAGLSASPKRLSSKYFYDARGSALFEEITQLPEYYLTRAETEILNSYADEMILAIEPEEFVELGAGHSVKTRLLIEALGRAGSGTRYVPFDISESALVEAAQHLGGSFPWLQIESLIGDFANDLTKIRRTGKRLVKFLGSTIGNFRSEERIAFYRTVARMLEEGDGLLLGVDLVKDENTLVAAYNDSAGVTAEFNKNILRVINRELEADFDIEAFDFIARWDAECECVSMSLKAKRDMDVTIKALDMVVHLDEHEEIHDEISCKFTRDKVEQEAKEAGLEITQWWTDSKERYAVALLRPSNE